MIKPKFKIWNWSIKEADELTAIFTSTVKTAKTNYLNQKSKTKNLKSD